MILICGATGFVGSYVSRQLARDGHVCRYLVRHPTGAEALAKLGEVVQGDITEAATLPAALAGVTTVIHLVGIIHETKKATFDSIHVEGTRNLVTAAQQAGVRHFIYISALGTRPQAVSRYHQTKYAAERLVIESGLPYTIFRPSVMYGQGGEFMEMLRDLASSPLIPIVGSGQSKMQPLFVGDLALAVARSLNTPAALNQVWDIAGPQALTFQELIVVARNKLGKSGALVKIPLFFIRPVVKIMERCLNKPPLTRDQLIMLQEDNVGDYRPVCQALRITMTTLSEGFTFE